MIHQTVILLTLCLLITACVSEAPKLDTSHELIQANPSISIYSKQPSESLRSDCESHNKKSVLHHCSLDGFDYYQIARALKESNAFESVSIADGDVDYAVTFVTAQINVEDAAELASAAIAGASLLLLPVVIEIDTRTEVEVLWRGIHIASYEYEFPVSNNVSLFSAQNQMDVNFANELSNHLMADILKDNPFTTPYLYTALNASDYNRDMVIPEQVGGFQLGSEHIFQDPFLGTSIQYTHFSQIGNYDVFVYPIRSTDWKDTEQVLAAELNQAQSEFEYLIKEGIWQASKITDQSITHLQLDDDHSVEVHWFKSELEDLSGEKFHSHTAIFTSNDKFVNLRATVPFNEKLMSDELLEGLIRQLQAPEESLFMAKLRKQVRDKEIK